MSAIINKHTETALSYNGNTLLYNGKELLYNFGEVELYKIPAFTFSESDMDTASIQCDVFIDANIDPNFASSWYISFEGEKFYLTTLKPQGRKDTASLKYVYSLSFQSERSDLSNFIMQDFSSTDPSAPVAVPQSQVFSFSGTLQQFVDRFQANLTFWFSSGRWIIDVNPEYSDTTTVTVTCDNASLWTTLQSLWDLYGVRWRIVEEGDNMIIKVAYSATEINHIFSYGMAANDERGLVSVERVGDDTDIYTILQGKGGSKNVPAGYMRTDSDPNYNSKIGLVYYPNIVTEYYRDYMRGWNLSEQAGPRIEGENWAFYLGYDGEATGKNINPVDYSKSESGIETYGEKWGALSPNEDIFPTIQGAERDGIGSVDEVVFVEEVLNDEYTESSDTGDEDDGVFNDKYGVKYEFNTTPAGTQPLISEDGDEFEIKENYNKITLTVSALSIATDLEDSPTEMDYPSPITIQIIVGLIDSDGEIYTAYSFQNKKSEYVVFEDIPVGTYSIRISTILFSGVASSAVHTTIQTYNTKIYNYTSEEQSEGFSQTFDVWIKDVWNTVKSAGETDEEYVDRVWLPLITTQEMTLLWSDGRLAGSDYEFIVAMIDGDMQIFHDTSKSLNGVDSEWRLSLIKSEAELEATKKYLPNINVNASSGDHFYFINIEMPYDPYVYDAERRTREWIDSELSLTDGESPSFTIKPSKIFINNTFSESEKLRAGAKIRLRDERLVGSSYVVLHVQSITKTYSQNSLNPEWDIVVSNDVIVNSNPISLLESSISALNSSNSISDQQIEEMAKAMSSIFLRKDGLSDTSYSETKFKENVSIAKSLLSSDFRQGQIGGSGGGIYRSENGDAILEIDKLNVRKEMNVTSLIINQVTHYGGKMMYSAANMKCSEVEEFDDFYRCYFDTKNGSLQNLFAEDDLAYCQRYSPIDNSVIKYYWRYISEAGIDYIDLAKLGGDGAGIPSVGDNIAQVGNSTNTERQSILIIDQIGNPSTVQYTGIDSFNFIEKNYVGYGVDRVTNEAFLYAYGRSYIGARDESQYVKFEKDMGVAGNPYKLTVKGNVEIIGGLLAGTVMVQNAAGSVAGLSGETGMPMIFAGAPDDESIDDALFRVLEDGSVFATKIAISGDSTFGGALSAATGTFTKLESGSASIEFSALYGGALQFNGNASFGDPNTISQLISRNSLTYGQSSRAQEAVVIIRDLVATYFPGGLIADTDIPDGQSFNMSETIPGSGVYSIELLKTVIVSTLHIALDVGLVIINNSATTSRDYVFSYTEFAPSGTPDSKALPGKIVKVVNSNGTTNVQRIYSMGNAKNVSNGHVRDFIYVGKNYSKEPSGTHGIGWLAGPVLVQSW